MYVCMYVCVQLGRADHLPRFSIENVSKWLEYPALDYSGAIEESINSRTPGILGQLWTVLLSLVVNSCRDPCAEPRMACPTTREHLPQICRPRTGVVVSGDPHVK